MVYYSRESPCLSVTSNCIQNQTVHYRPCPKRVAYVIHQASAIRSRSASSPFGSSAKETEEQHRSTIIWRYHYFAFVFRLNRTESAYDHFVIVPPEIGCQDFVT